MTPAPPADAHGPPGSAPAPPADAHGPSWPTPASPADAHGPSGSAPAPPADTHGPSGQPPAPPGLATSRPEPPEQSREDTDTAWGEYPEPAVDRFARDRPPHWDDF